ncbi:MAG: hypothetical protein VKK42_05515 [Lyngbya sp.]|nr:hypothetical protein [Lyngbya sp.]
MNSLQKASVQQSIESGNSRLTEAWMMAIAIIILVALQAPTHSQTPSTRSQPPTQPFILNRV